jgi:hypothetical protein
VLDLGDKEDADKAKTEGDLEIIRHEGSLSNLVNME